MMMHHSHIRYNLQHTCVLELLALVFQETHTETQDTRVRQNADRMRRNGETVSSPVLGIRDGIYH